MNGDQLYLRPNVQVEPLVDQWYAWTHLISPATAARNLTERHLRILDSYIAAPRLHAASVKDPKLLGGPFVDLGGERVSEIRELRDTTRRTRAAMLELSAGISELDCILRKHATGYSLQPLYDMTPDTLRGYVELVYDLNNHPYVRWIEPLLYKSRYYEPSAQSVMLSVLDGDDRPFVLSTPRLEDERSAHLRLPFNSDSLDELFRVKASPRSYSSIRDALDVPEHVEALFRSFFTTEAPASYERYSGSGVRWRYFGHACILIETSELTLLFDPVLSYTYDSGISRYTYEDLPEHIDYVLITHNHQDHVLLETLLQIRHKVGVVVVPRNGASGLQDPSLKLCLRACGFSRIAELAELESIDLPDGEITGLPFLGEHADLDIRTKLAYCVRLGRRKIVLAADSSNLEPALYQRLHSEIGDIDVLFLGMECTGAPLTWLYGPLLSRKLDRAMDESRRLSGSNYEQAIRIVEDLGCREVYVYAMGQEPWLNYVMSVKYTEQSRPIVDSNRLIAECASRGVCAERLFGEKEILLG
jgi:L-ascorbate metabolism protein UlaG (beta-lactamase superfamily)